ncbi:3'3'-cGAMP-specific phosphodiesterase 2 [Fundidesulfovibrio magnetotacticus]|uniref:3'3'-cGAMP-specific phosphodiesterase 2 n=1 Tax=Fundidesulfovibrio magnetotacticus TaxID=2730080 RepID=A0A6V8LJ64_9BACT|nr:HD domain-containing phosphohydrolase [Fundidesulfovibrio magnetotacticus]GFK92763.1 3'3'-cGAMP-specific phosphodiesterase 2 [Fundidesulfovibrio magnetotacticus]
MQGLGPRILLVDDEPGVLEVCAESLADLAQTVSTARDGLQAMEHLREGSFDLVVSDLRMPGASGVDLLRTMNSSAPDTDLIVLTGYGTIESAVECVRLGAVNYLLKPFKVEDLRAAVIKAFTERSLRVRAGAGGLSRMLALSAALSARQEARALVKEFLAQVSQAFAPDGIAFFSHGSDRSDGQRHIFLGPYFRENPGVRTWFESLSAGLARKGRPMLFEEQLLRDAFAAQEARPPISALGAPLTFSEGSGAVVALRAAGSAPYGVEDLKLFTLFASHASVCFESTRACTRLKAVNEEIVFSLVHAVEAKDTYTRGHSERVSRYAVKLARHLKLPTREVDLARTAGMLHDIGKIGVPDNILNKAGPLDESELPVMRQHPAIARTILGKVESLGSVLPVVYHHHERFDGTGYPDGLAGESIPFLARLVSVVDGFEAMTSDRAYHRGRALETARDILRQGAGSQWDPVFVHSWLELLDKPSAA